MLFPQNTELNKPYQKTKSRMGPKSIGEGQIVQVQGGHIIRATGRKDRHSKVFTAKGPRDRRVRLSAHTAIQFYDVQDRLGYDRPSKAVDWLIQNAKASIDKLAELPPLNPFAASSATVDGRSCSNHVHGSNECVAQGGDSMKSFFPTTSEVDINTSMNLQNYPHSQDLCLSLQSLQDTENTTNQTHGNQDQTLFQGSESLGFDIGSTGWPDPSDHHNHQDMARFTRLMGWAGNEGRSGIMVNNANLFSHHQSYLLSQQGSAMTYSQRGTLQSSFPPFVRTLEDHQHQHQSMISSIGHGSDAFMGFCFPSSHVHGDLNGGPSVSNRASSSSFSPDSSQH